MIYNKEQILYDQEYVDHICIIKNVFYYSYIVSLLLEDINSPLFIVLLSLKRRVSTQCLPLSYTLTLCKSYLLLWN